MLNRDQSVNTGNTQPNINGGGVNNCSRKSCEGNKNCDRYHRNFFPEVMSYRRIEL